MVAEITPRRGPGSLVLSATLIAEKDTKESATKMHVPSWICTRLGLCIIIVMVVGVAALVPAIVLTQQQDDKNDNDSPSDGLSYEFEFNDEASFFVVQWGLSVPNCQKKNDLTMEIKCIQGNGQPFPREADTYMEVIDLNEKYMFDWAPDNVTCQHSNGRNDTIQCMADMSSGKLMDVALVIVCARNTSTTTASSNQQQQETTNIMQLEASVHSASALNCDTDRLHPFTSGFSMAHILFHGNGGQETGTKALKDDDELQLVQSVPGDCLNTAEPGRTFFAKRNDKDIFTCWQNGLCNPNNLAANGQCRNLTIPSFGMKNVITQSAGILSKRNDDDDDDGGGGGRFIWDIQTIWSVAENFFFIDIKRIHDEP